MDLLQNIWNGILNLTKLLVIPDWGGLILLLPVFVGVITILFLIWLVLQYRRIGKRRRRPGRPRGSMCPVPPSARSSPPSECSSCSLGSCTPDRSWSSGSCSWAAPFSAG